MNPLSITYPINGLLMIAIPIALGLFLARRFKIGWRLWWIGAVTFVLSQVGHIPFNILLTRLFQNGVLPAPPEQYRLVFNAVVLGLSAGLWEECARYATYRWWARDARTWGKGLMLGAGHGGIEAIILGVLVLVNFVGMYVALNMSLEQMVSSEQLILAQQQMDAYWSVSWYLPLLGALERLFAIIFHLVLSLFVLQVFLRRQIFWLWLAVGWHAVIDAVAVYLMGKWGIFAAEATLAVMAVASIGLIFVLRNPEIEPVETVEPLMPLPEIRTADTISIRQDDISVEQLEDSRYGSS